MMACVWELQESRRHVGGVLADASRATGEGRCPQMTQMGADGTFVLLRACFLAANRHGGE